MGLRLLASSSPKVCDSPELVTKVEGHLEKQMLMDGLNNDQQSSPQVSPGSSVTSPRVRVSIQETGDEAEESAISPGKSKRRATVSSKKMASVSEEGHSNAEEATVESAETTPESPMASHRKNKRASTTPAKPDKPTESPTGTKLSALSGKKSTLMKSRMRRLLERRKQEFASWPPVEQQRLKQAFNAGDSSGLAMLDSKGLRVAFTELGLEGRNRHEKEAILAISREAASIRGNINFFDFVFQLVAEVEQKLEEMRSPKLYAEFQQIDDKGTGRLKEQQCLYGLEQHAWSILEQQQVDEEDLQAFWKAFVKDFPDMFRARGHGADGTVDFKGFQLLATQLDTRSADYFQSLEKRIARLECLPPQLEADHNGELSFLKRIFDSCDTSSQGPQGQISKPEHPVLCCRLASLPPLVLCGNGCNRLWTNVRASSSRSRTTWSWWMVFATTTNQ